MPEKPSAASGYPPGQVARVRATCLYLASKLGELMPELVVVGGLVPSLLIDQHNLPENVTAHVGTMDLDLGLAFTLVGEARYQEVAERLSLTFATATGFERN
jgi:excinuclease UvrABC ATPase subunit